MEKKNGEIDLLNLLLQFVNLVRENFWLILTFFLIGAGLGSASYFTARKVYENKMVISSEILTRPYAEISIDRISTYLGEGNREAIAKDLKLSPEIVEELSDFSIESLTESEDPKEADRFILTAETYSQEVLPDLQKALVAYFENNEFVKIRVDHNKKLYTQMISKVETEIRDMEGWKQKIMSGAFFQNANGVIFDPTTINSKIIDLTKERISLENSLALVNSVQVIEGFTPFQKPTKPKLSISLISGATIGLVFVLIFLGLKSIRKLLQMADIANEKQ
jgi:hypothetical protein